MELQLLRQIRTENSTIGKLLIDGGFCCYILEDFDRKLRQDMPLSEIKKIKVKAKTAIPSGRYKVIITYSPRFKRMLPILLNVPGFEGIRMHSGILPIHTEGCLLPGMGYEQDKLVDSRVAFDKLYKILLDAIQKNQQIFITIS